MIAYEKQDGSFRFNTRGVEIEGVWTPTKRFIHASKSALIAHGFTVVDYVQDIEAVASVAENKKAELTQARRDADEGKFTYNGKTYDGSSESRSKMDAITGMIALGGGQNMPTGWVGGWKAEDNTLTAITTVSEWSAFYGAMVAQGQANFVQAEQLKGLVDAIVADSGKTDAQKITDIKAISWGQP